MNRAYPFQAAKLVRPWAFLLICLVVFLGGCRAEAPPLSQNAKALTLKHSCPVRYKYNKNYTFAGVDWY